MQVEFKLVVLQDQWMHGPKDFGALSTHDAARLPELCAAHLQDCGLCGGFVADAQDSYNFCEDCHNEVFCEDCFYAERTHCINCDSQQEVPEPCPHPSPPSVDGTDATLSDALQWAYQNALLHEYDHLHEDEQLVLACCEFRDGLLHQYWVSPPVCDATFYDCDKTWTLHLPYARRYAATIARHLPLPRDLQGLVYHELCK